MDFLFDYAIYNINLKLTYSPSDLYLSENIFAQYIDFYLISGKNETIFGVFSFRFSVFLIFFIFLVMILLKPTQITLGID